MEKDQPESMATVTIKPDYPPSEVYSSEPPPAYKYKSTSVQITKIVAVTVILSSVILGAFLLASAYVTANASCRQLEQELEFLNEAADRFQQQQSAQPLQPEALIQEHPLSKSHAEPLQTQETKSAVAKEVDSNRIDENDSDTASDNSVENSDSSDDSDSSNESDEDERTPIHFKLPLQLDFDDLAGAMIEKNQKSKMNCIVEKKRAEEVVDHQPKTVRLPFGVNLTTDPRYERVTGERMVIVCESGNFQRAVPQPQPQVPAQPQEEDDEQDTIMIQPVMIPIPHSHFPTHMPQQMQPQSAQAQQPQAQIQIIHPMEQMRPPMPPMMQQLPQQQQGPQQSQMPPNPIIQHIIQQIIAQKIMDSQRAQEEQQQREQREEASPEMEQRVSPRMFMPQGLPGRLPVPEEVLTQLNRLPNREGIVVVAEQKPEEPEQNFEVVSRPWAGNNVDIDRQTYARGLPVNIPVPMTHQEPQEQQEQQQEQQEPQAAATEEVRPHYVQPRSVRSVDALLAPSQKRVKRCACDCAC